MSALEEQLLLIIRDEIRRMVKQEALADEVELDGDLELRQLARSAATRLRRARQG